MTVDVPVRLPRILTYPSCADPPVLVAQGAEARLYRTTFLTPDRPCALKYRPPKSYRHPALDARLTRQRILAEARILHRCRREGVPVPALYAVDMEEAGPDSGLGHGGGSLLAEWIDGEPVRASLNTWLDHWYPAKAGGPGSGTDASANASASLDADPEILSLMRRIGAAVGSLHRVGIVHGDLTTSNLMLRPVASPADSSIAKTTAAAPAPAPASSTATPPPPAPTATATPPPPAPTATATPPPPDPTLRGDVIIIDFGLASQSSSDEDRAVDLYVLERAFGSTHPRAEHLFSEVLVAYRTAYKNTAPVLRKLEDVRMRGRKRSMLG